MFDLINVFEVFLPQLLLYPNPTDPLNGDAAALLMREPQSYNARVRGEPCSAIAAQLLWRGTHGPGHAHAPTPILPPAELRVHSHVHPSTPPHLSTFLTF